MRTAVITGGMGGLGDSISSKMHAAGYRVAVTHSPGNQKEIGSLSTKQLVVSSAHIPSMLLISIPAGNVSVVLVKRLVLSTF